MKTLILLLSILISSSVFALVWPVDCIPGQDCQWYSYPDIDRDGKSASCGLLGTKGFGYIGHSGTDIGAPHGTDVLAAESWKVFWVFDVKFSQCNINRLHAECNLPLSRTHTPIGPYCKGRDCSLFFNGGNTTVILHPDSNVFATRYSHLAQHSSVVSPGDEVTKGQKIAKIGASGNANVEHLHFSVWGVTYNNNVDPWSGACGREESLWDLNPLLLGSVESLIANFKGKVPIIKKTKSLRRLLDKIIVKHNKGKSICTKLNKVSKKIDKLIKKKKIEESLGWDLITDSEILKPYLGCQKGDDIRKANYE